MKCASALLVWLLLFGSYGSTDPRLEVKPTALPFLLQIVASTSNGFVPFCSGSLIARNYLLTAAHCVEKFYNDSSWNSAVFIIPHSAGGDSPVIHPKKVIRSPSYQSTPHDAANAITPNEATDWALIELDKPLNDITPVKIQSYSLPELKKMRLIAAGFAHDVKCNLSKDGWVLPLMKTVGFVTETIHFLSTISR